MTGNYVEEDPVALLAAKPDFFRIFTLVIATQVASCRCWTLACALHAQCRPFHPDSWNYKYVHVQMREEELLQLEAVTWNIGIPLLIARSYGLMGYVRVGQLQAHIAVHRSVAVAPCERAACSVSTSGNSAAAPARVLGVYTSLICRRSAAQSTVW